MEHSVKDPSAGSEMCFDVEPLGRIVRSLASDLPICFGLYDTRGEGHYLSAQKGGSDGLPGRLSDDPELWSIAKENMVGPVGRVSRIGNDSATLMSTVQSDGIATGVIVVKLDSADLSENQLSCVFGLTQICAALASELMTHSQALSEMTNELSGRYEELSLLYELNGALDLSTNQAHALDLIAVSVAETLIADLVFLAVPGLRIERVYPPLQSKSGPWKVLVEILIERAPEDGRGVGANNIHRDEALDSIGAGFAHALVAPLRIGDFGGYFALFRQDEGRPFVTGDAKILEAVATQTSLALSNAQVIQEQKKLFDVSIFSLARLAESRDMETGAHLERMSNYSRVLADEVSTFEQYRTEMNSDYVDAIYRSSPLHDIGKVGIPDSILLKPGKLTPDEWAIMKAHSTIGGDTLRDAETRLEAPGETFLTLGKLIAYYHHEKWDGSGYPEGLSGEQIPLSARIVALADAYDAITSKRCYKEAESHEVARAEIIRSSGSHFDPDIVEAFLSVEDEFQAIHRAFANPDE